MIRLMIIAFLSLLAGCEGNEGLFLLSNKSGEVIAKAEVVAGREFFDFKNIMIGDEIITS